MKRSVLVLGVVCGLLGGCTTVRGIPNPTMAADGKAVQQDVDGVLSYAVATEIAAPPAAVFGLLTTTEGYTAWNSTVVSFKGKVAKGEKVSLVSKLDPSRTFELKVSELVQDKTLVWEDGMPMGLFAGVRTYEVTALPDGRTRFVMAEVFSGPMLLLTAGIVTSVTLLAGSYPAKK